MEKETGKLGEEYVAGKLRKKGYKILQRNYYSRFGEIDIIAEKGKILAFVEVKTREQGSMTHPLEAITISKQKRLIQTAQMFLLSYRGNGQPRFDAAAVFVRGGKVVSMEYFENVIVS